MSEFLGRWLLVGGAAALGLVAAGTVIGGWWLWAVAVLWIGFWNAAVRPGVLRLGFSGVYVFWAMLLSLLVLNGLLFLGVSTWIPWASVSERRGLLWAVVCVSLVSWALSIRFRARDGRWHWISYHGAVTGKGSVR